MHYQIPSTFPSISLLLLFPLDYVKFLQRVRLSMYENPLFTDRRLNTAFHVFLVLLALVQVKNAKKQRMKSTWHKQSTLPLVSLTDLTANTTMLILLAKALAIDNDKKKTNKLAWVMAKNQHFGCGRIFLHWFLSWAFIS